MVETEMLAHAYLHTRCIQPIDVVRTSELGAQPARAKAILVRLRQQPHYDATRQSSQQRITNTHVRDAIHSQIDLLVLLIDLRDRTGAVILCKVVIRQKVYRWVDWISLVPAC